MNYTITLTEAENLALSFVAVSQQEWIDNAVHSRCLSAIEQIVSITVQKCLETGVQLPGTKDEIVILAFEQGWVITAEQQNLQTAERLQSEVSSNV